MSKLTDDMSLDEMTTELRKRPAGVGTLQSDPTFQHNKLVYKIVTLLHRDEYAATQYLKQLESMVGKEDADEMVQKGLRNQKNKKRIV